VSSMYDKFLKCCQYAIVTTIGLVFCLVIVALSTMRAPKPPVKTAQQLKRDACILRMMNFELAVRGKLGGSYSDYDIYCDVTDDR
jgi:hypothetical protein